ncbi:hypothetical protein ILUMI_16724, partial [Ignelater luminosus]
MAENMFDIAVLEEREGDDLEEFLLINLVEELRERAMIRADRLKGAYPGRRHDAGIFRESDLYAQLERHCAFPNKKIVLYGDPRNRNLTDEQHAFNFRMSTVRGFGKITSEF